MSSVFVIRPGWTFAALPMKPSGDGKLAQFQKLIACGEQKTGHIEPVPHEGDRDDVVMAYCNEEGTLIENAGFNDLGAHVLEILGYDLCAFFPAAVRGPIIFTGFNNEDGDEEGLTKEQVDALTKLCTDIKAKNDDPDAEDIGKADQLKWRAAAACLFRGATREAMDKKKAENQKKKEQKQKKKKQTEGAGAGAGAGGKS